MLAKAQCQIRVVHLMYRWLQSCQMRAKRCAGVDLKEAGVPELEQAAQLASPTKRRVAPSATATQAADMPDAAPAARADSEMRDAAKQADVDEARSTAAAEAKQAALASKLAEQLHSSLLFSVDLMGVGSNTPTMSSQDEDAAALGSARARPATLLRCKCLKALVRHLLLGGFGTCQSEVMQACMRASLSLKLAQQQASPATSDNLFL